MGIKPPQFKPEYIAGAKAHVDEGYSFNSFAGRLGIQMKYLSQWAREYPELGEIRARYNYRAQKKKCFIIPSEDVAQAGGCGSPSACNELDPHPPLPRIKE